MRLRIEADELAAGSGAGAGEASRLLPYQFQVREPLHLLIGGSEEGKDNCWGERGEGGGKGRKRGGEEE